MNSDFRIRKRLPMRGWVDGWTAGKKSDLKIIQTQSKDHSLAQHCGLGWSVAEYAAKSLRVPPVLNTFKGKKSSNFNG